MTFSFCRIMVLDEGRLVEMDTPRELALRPGSVFRGMIEEANLMGALVPTAAATADKSEEQHKQQ